MMKYRTKIKWISTASEKIKLLILYPLKKKNSASGLVFSGSTAEDI